MNNKIYCLDTNLFINCWNCTIKIYFLIQIIFLIIKEKSSIYSFYVHKQVIFELEQHKDKLFDWVKKNQNIFKDYPENDQKISEKYTKMNTKYPLLAKHNENSADPFIIASTIVLQGVIVSNEKGKQLPKEISKIKSIPHACEKEGIAHLTVFEFLEEIGFKFN